MKLLKFTEPNGMDVWVVASWITHVSKCDESPSSTRKTRIHLSDGIQDVAESLEEVVHDLKEAL